MEICFIAHIYTVFVSGDRILDWEGDELVMFSLDTEFLLDFEECFDRRDHIEDGNVGSRLSEAFGECETTASSTSCD